MAEIFYRFRVEGVRTSPGNPSLIVQRYNHFHTKPRLVVRDTLNDTPMSAVGFRLTEEDAKEYYAEIQNKIKQFKKSDALIEYQITHIEFLLDGEVFASTRMATPALSGLIGAALLVDMRRELKQHLEKLATI